MSCKAQVSCTQSPSVSFNFLIEFFFWCQLAFLLKCLVFWSPSRIHDAQLKWLVFWSPSRSHDARDRCHHIISSWYSTSSSLLRPCGRPRLILLIVVLFTTDQKLIPQLTNSPSHRAEVLFGPSLQTVLHRPKFLGDITKRLNIVMLAPGLLNCAL